MDSNLGPLVSEATSLPTAPHTLPMLLNLVGITDLIVLKSLIKHATRLHPHDICLDVFIVHFYFTDLSYSFHFFLCLSMPPGAKTIKLILQKDS